MHRTNPHLVTAGLVILAIIAFAGNSLLARAALGNGLIGPGSFTALRLVAGAIILLPWLLRANRQPSNWRGAMMLLLYCGGFSFAYLQLNAATGAMVLFAAVQITILVAGRANGAHITMLDVAGVSLALGGVGILLGANFTLGPIIAMASMMLAGIGWGLYSLLGRAAADPARGTAANFLLAALLAMPLPLLDEAGSVTAAGAVLAIASGAITSALGYVIWYMVVPRLAHSTVGAVQLATPVVAAVAAAALLSEPLTLRVAVASVAIMAGIAATLKRP